MGLDPKVSASKRQAEFIESFYLHQYCAGAYKVQTPAGIPPLYGTGHASFWSECLAMRTREHVFISAYSDAWKA